MRTRVLAPLALMPVVGQWIEVCEAQPPSQAWAPVPSPSIRAPLTSTPNP